MNRFTFLLALIILGLSTVSRAEAPDNEVRTETRTYKTTPQGDLGMILQYPEGWNASDHRPAIVFFFGGGWTNGSTEQFLDQADALARRGMVAARADYRVKSRQGVTPDKCVEDARSAMRWLKKHASELGIDANRIVAAGGSAGGHLAACTVTANAPDSEDDDRSISPRPSALVLFNPVVRFDNVPQLVERVDGDAALARRLSPTLDLDSENPPALLLYGTEDRLLAQGQEYVDRSKAVGVRAELFTAEGVGHGFFNRPPWKELTIKRMIEFLESLGYIDSNEH